MSRIIFFRCNISLAREATVKQGLTEKNLIQHGRSIFYQRSGKLKNVGLFSSQPDLGLVGSGSH